MEIIVEYERIFEQKKLSKFIFQKLIRKFIKSNKQTEIDNEKEIDDQIQNFSQKVLIYLFTANESECKQHYDYIKFIYFKLTYLPNPFEFRWPLDINQNEEIKNNILLIMNKMTEIIAYSKKNPKTYDIDYERNFNQQEFKEVVTYYENFKEEQEKNKANKINNTLLILKKEEKFISDLNACLDLIKNEVIFKFKKGKKQTLHNRFLKDFIMPESPINIIQEYEIPNFQFFDKFKLCDIIINSENIKNLSEDETYLYFMAYSFLYVIKYNYNFVNINHRLSCLIEHIENISNANNHQLKFQDGYIFIMKFMKDIECNNLIGKNQCEENVKEVHIFDLFKKWIATDYQVSDSWINKEQIQLYIDYFQSVGRLGALPELIRFYDIQSQIPYQPSNLEIGYVQQIIRGKRLYQLFPHEMIQHKSYWQNLCDGMMARITFQRQRKHERKYRNQLENEPFQLSDKYITIKLCQINFKMCELFTTVDTSQENSSIVVTIEILIDELLNMIDSSQYLNIYRQKQLFQTLKSLFIEEDYVLLILLKRIKNPDCFCDDDIQIQSHRNIIPSMKQEFFIGRYISMSQKRTFSLSNSDQSFQWIHHYFLKAKNGLNQIPLDQSLKEFKDIQNHYILKRKKYEILPKNIKFYIQYIELKMEIQNSLNDQYQIEFQVEKIFESQFVVKKILIEGQVYVVKEIKEGGKTEAEKQQMQEKLLTETAILAQLEKHENIIEFINYQVKKGQCQLFLEFCSKGSLQDYLNDKIINKRTVEPQTKLRFCLEILKGVEHLHKNKIIHADLKMTNILLTENEKIKIIDFSESAFMIEKTKGFTRFYVGNDKLVSIYNDYYGVGMILLNLLLTYNFSSYYGNTYKQQDKKEIDEKKQIKEFIKTNLNSVKVNFCNEYSEFLFNQIMNLFTQQPYLRSPLQELITFIEIHIQYFGYPYRKKQELEKYIKRQRIIKSYTSMRQNLINQQNSILYKKLQKYCYTKKIEEENKTFQYNLLDDYPQQDISASNQKNYNQINLQKDEEIFKPCDVSFNNIQIEEIKNNDNEQQIIIIKDQTQLQKELVNYFISKKEEEVQLQIYKIISNGKINARQFGVGIGELNTESFSFYKIIQNLIKCLKPEQFLYLLFWFLKLSQGCENMEQIQSKFTEYI